MVIRCVNKLYYPIKLCYIEFVLCVFRGSMFCGSGCKWRSNVNGVIIWFKPIFLACKNYRIRIHFIDFRKNEPTLADSGLFFKIRVSKPGDFSVLSNKGWKYAVIASDNKNKVHLMAGAKEISWTWIVMTREKNDRTWTKDKQTHNHIVEVSHLSAFVASL